MSATPNYTDPYYEATAFQQGGCLSRFLLPPLAVIGIGLLLVFIWLGAGPVSTGLAAAPGQSELNQLAATGQSADPLLANPQLPGAISPVFSPEVQYWRGSIQAWAASAGLDPNLVATVMQIESCGDPRAHSGAGAIGLFQVMPYHFSSGDDPYIPATNAVSGLAYLKRSLEVANGDARLALAGYNGGIGVIKQPEMNWAAETRRYAYWGSGIYREASNGATESSRLQEWMAAGGLSLCNRASARLGINQ